MKKNPELPPRVFPHGRWYRLMVAQGSKRVPHNLSLIADGLPALWRAFRAFEQSDSTLYLMPALIADWQDEVMVRHKPTTQVYDRYVCEQIADAFAEYTPAEPQPPDCTEFLNRWADKPRSYNGYRAMLRELFRFAIEKGLRPLGTNPISSGRGDVVIRTKATPARERCPTTSELRRMKIACLYGKSGGRKSREARTRTGLTMAAFIEVCYLTGQDVGRVVLLRESKGDDDNEPYLTREGISFRRSKTGGRVVIGWTPRLVAAVAALRRIKAEKALAKRMQQRPAKHPYLFTKQDGTPLDYEAMSNAWQRGMQRFIEAGGEHFKARDIRSRAATDKDIKEGRSEARKMTTHTTEAQLAAYLRDKNTPTTKATA